MMSSVTNIKSIITDELCFQDWGFRAQIPNKFCFGVIWMNLAQGNRESLITVYLIFQTWNKWDFLSPLLL